MTCGIYLLAFTSGKMYIGQSVDIENRWNQHFDKFRKGTAAKLMQAEFNRCGFPSTQILKECHKDNLDMMESLYINHNMIKQKHLMLNTSIPQDYTDTQIAFITSHEEYLKYSIFELMRGLNTAKDNIKHLEATIEEFEEDGIVLPKEIRNIKEKNKELHRTIYELSLSNQELLRRANMSWFERLFN